MITINENTTNSLDLDVYQKSSLSYTKKLLLKQNGVIMVYPSCHEINFDVNVVIHIAIIIIL